MEPALKLLYFCAGLQLVLYVYLFQYIKVRTTLSEKYTSMIEFEHDLVQYIDRYNNQRAKARLIGMSPLKFCEHYWAA